MATTNVSDTAAAVADKWGPALTKAIKEGDAEDFKALFTDDLIEVVIQNAEGGESCFTIGDDNEEATLEWKTFLEMSIAELKEQDYVKTESQCLGILGPRCILEMGRFNSKGEVYQESISLLTLDEKTGLIVAVEAFTDPGMSTLTELAAPVEGSS